METHTPLVIEKNPIEDLDDRSDVDCQTGLFGDFSRDRRLERFADFERPSRQAPVAGERLEAALHEHHSTPGQLSFATDVRTIAGSNQDDRSDAHNRACRVFPIRAANHRRLPIADCGS
jgi:hypothetical protein